jgi:pilus assembly protein CpaE
MITAGVVVTDPEMREQIVNCLKDLHVQVAFAVADTAGQAHLLDSSNPDLLVLDFSQPGILAVMAEITALGAPVAVVAVHAMGEPEAILAALRMGAREFLYPPINEKALADAVRTIEIEKARRDARRRSGKAVGFLSAAGGCGATTVACHVAAELRRSGAGEVGLLDFDLSAGMAGFWFGTNGSYSALDAVHGLGRLDESLWKGLVNTVQPHLDVLSAPAEIPLGGLPGARGFVDVLRFARGQYDWVIADLSLHLTAFSLALLVEMDTAFVVTNLEVASLLQTRRLIQAIVQYGYPKERLKVVVSRVQKDQVHLVDDLKNMIGIPAEAVLPSDSQEIAEAHAEGRLIRPKSDLGKRLAQLSAKIGGKPLEEPRPAKFSLFRFGAQEA